MIIKTLVENTSISKEFNTEHGLSLYIETKNRKLLFDLGASGLFIENAKKLGVDLSAVDIVIVSHGHYDHGGGLKAFLDVNSKAKIYLNQKAFDRHYAVRPNGEKAYIGLDEGLSSNNRFIFVADYLCIDEELELFSNIKGKQFISLGNRDLLKELGNSFVQDDFIHEQNLIVKEDGKMVLVAGCAHSGIVNIIDQINQMKRKPADVVIGGFHLYNPAAKKNEDPELISQIGAYLKNTDSIYYTCHCTGIEPYQNLKAIMGKKIQYLAGGSQLIV